jgi:Ricin-type beta-trefoil lectin domain
LSNEYLEVRAVYLQTLIYALYLLNRKGLLPLSPPTHEKGIFVVATLQTPKRFSLIALLILGLCSQQTNATGMNSKEGASASLNSSQKPRSQARILPGRYLDIQSLLDGRANVKTSPLLSGVRIPKLVPQAQPPQFNDYHVSSASLVREQGELDGALVVVTRNNGSFIAIVDTSTHRGIVIGKADGTQTFHEEKKYDFLKPDMVKRSPESIAHEEATLALAAKKKYAHHNAAEPITITVLIGFSQQAATAVSDPTAFAFGQLEIANLGLRNSGVENVRLQLTGIEITPDDYPIAVETIGKLPWLFKNEKAADLVGGFFIGNSQDTAVGWGSTPGRYTIQGTWTTDTFAHELGHNAGGYHCNSTGEDNYKFGYENGKYGTFLCRSYVKIFYYSTPDKVDDEGAPLGNARTADMARQWRERAPFMASYGDSQPVQFPFVIHSKAQPNECVDVLEGKLSAGSRVGLYNCHRELNQQWIKWPDDSSGRIRPVANQNLCLANDREAGGTAILKDCSIDDSTVRWTETGDRFINGDYPVSMPEVLVRANNTLQINHSNNTTDPALLWTKEEITPFQLKNTKSNYCADISGGYIVSGASVILYPCQSKQANQQWLMDNSGRIRVANHENLCLYVNSSYPHRASLYNCSPTTSYILWRHEANGHLTSFMGNNFCLTGLLSPGDPLVILSCGSSDGQTWIKVPFRAQR